jgi:hypothetical protein
MLVITDRTKSLQTATLPMVRSIRAVLCGVLPVRLPPLPSQQFSRIDRILEAALNALVVAEQVFGDVEA